MQQKSRQQIIANNCIFVRLQCGKNCRASVVTNREDGNEKFIEFKNEHTDH
jgi:hypothetical protein